MSQFERVAKLSELTPGGRLSVVVEDQMVLLIRQGDEIVGIEDVCSHDGQPLTQGAVIEGSIVCPRHGAKFDLRTGAALCMPATEGVATFAVKIENGEIFVSTSPSPPIANTLPLSHSTTESCCSTAAVPEPPESEAGCNPKESETPPDEAGLLEALKQVVDPELMINIVDLGLIYNVRLESHQVEVEMTLTSPACPAGPQIMQQSKMAIEKLPGITGANIKLVMTPPWSPERMTDDARDQLGIF